MGSWLVCHKRLGAICAWRGAPSAARNVFRRLMNSLSIAEKPPE
jgi:hypothetical protein